MSAAQMMVGFVVAVLPSLFMFWLHATDKTRSSLGARVGRLEQRMDFEDGRRAGRAEALAERGSDGK